MDEEQIAHEEPEPVSMCVEMNEEQEHNQSRYPFTCLFFYLPLKSRLTIFKISADITLALEFITPAAPLLYCDSCCLSVIR